MSSKAKAVTIIPREAGIESKVSPEADPLETAHQSEQAMALPEEDSDPPAPPPKRKSKNKNKNK